MPASPAGCGNCDRPVSDSAQICTTCAAALAKACRGVPGVLDDLLIAYVRQDRIGCGDGGRSSAETPLLVRLDVSECAWELGNTLTTWARDLGAVWHAMLQLRGRYRDPVMYSAAVAALWLAGHTDAIRAHPAALEACRDIDRAIARARAKTDRPAPLAYRGQCWECEAELRAAPGAAIVTCSSCGERHDGPKLRAWLLGRVADQLVTAAELSAALTGLSETSVAVGTIHSWRSRGKLAPHAWLHDRLVVARPLDSRDRPLFRVGDATELLGTSRAG